MPSEVFFRRYSYPVARTRPENFLIMNTIIIQCIQVTICVQGSDPDMPPDAGESGTVRNGISLFP